MLPSVSLNQAALAPPAEMVETEMCALQDYWHNLLGKAS
jgi:hypothetical protein